MSDSPFHMQQSNKSLVRRQESDGAGRSHSREEPPGQMSTTPLSNFWQFYLRNTMHRAAIADVTASSSWETIHKAQAQLDAEDEAVKNVMLALRARRNAISVVSRLPVDVLLYIFTFLVDEDPPIVNAYHTNLKPLFGWINVTFVCRLWREVALANAHLWRRIEGLPSLEWARAMLSRSKACPLNVDATYFVVDSDVVDLILSPSSLCRISELIMLLRGDDIRYLSKLAEPAPILETLCISFSSGDNSPLPEIITNTLHPRLRRLIVRNHPRVPCTIQVLRNLILLDIGTSGTYAEGPTLEQLTAIIHECHRLEELSLRRFGPGDQTFDVATVEGLHSRRRISLPHLKSLELLGEGCGVPLLLSQVDFPASAGVWIHLEPADSDVDPSWDYIPQLLPWVAVGTDRKSPPHFDSLAVETNEESWISARMPATACRNGGTRPSLRITARKCASSLGWLHSLLRALHARNYYRRVTRCVLLARAEADVGFVGMGELLASPGMSELRELRLIEPMDPAVPFFQSLYLAPAAGVGPAMLLPALECLVLQGPELAGHIPTFALSSSVKKAVLAFLAARQLYRRPLSQCKLEDCGELGNFVDLVDELCKPPAVPVKSRRR
ncbi:hypothetical protein DENSPDRAFT_842755 [Dentipellis sp. KUC8613]|nr:hypothetical protein DENSPDRAFT_842755 [Dentipellis sp. KUC8613]